MAPESDDTPITIGGPVTLRPRRRKPSLRTRHTAALIFAIVVLVVTGLVIQWILRGEPSLGDTAAYRDALLKRGLSQVSIQAAEDGKGTIRLFRTDPAEPRCEFVLHDRDGIVRKVVIHLLQGPFPPASAPGSPPPSSDRWIWMPETAPGTSVPSRPIDPVTAAAHEGHVRAFLQRFFPQINYNRDVPRTPMSPRSSEGSLSHTIGSLLEFSWQREPAGQYVAVTLTVALREEK